MFNNTLFRFSQLYIFILLIFSAGFFSGCSDQNSDAFRIGSNFVNPQTNIVVVDTFTIRTSTFLLDSLSTTSPDQFLVGEFNDEYFGKTSASGYFQIAVPDSTDINENSVFDSLTIRLRYADYYYGDTLQPYTIQVFRVNETMEEPDEVYFYNNTSFTYDKFPLGTATFKPRPKTDDYIEVRLNDDLGKEIMKLMVDDDDAIKSNDDFVEFLNGIVLKGGDNNNSVLSFAATDSSVNLKLYTHYIAEERRDGKYNLPLYTEGKYFNHIEADRTGTPIEMVKTRKEEISSDLTDNKTFMQAGTGVLTRVDFPSVYRIMEIEQRYIYYRAELIFRPVHKSNEQVPFPEELILYTTNKYNEIVSQVTDSNDDAVTSEFNYDEQYNEDNYYSFDITSFLSNILNNAYIDQENGLVIGFPEDKYKGTLDRLVFDARTTDAYRPELKLYFVFYN